MSKLKGKKLDQFEVWWDLYAKKRDRSECESLWLRKVSEKDVPEIMEHTREYVEATPDKSFRRDPRRYLLRENWRDEDFIDSIKTEKNDPQEQARKNRRRWDDLLG